MKNKTKQKTNLACLVTYVYTINLTYSEHPIKFKS